MGYSRYKFAREVYHGGAPLDLHSRKGKQVQAGDLGMTPKDKDDSFPSGWHCHCLAAACGAHAS